MTYFLTAYNYATHKWDILDKGVPSTDCEILRKQLLESTDYTIINIVSECK